MKHPELIQKILSRIDDPDLFELERYINELADRLKATDNAERTWECTMMAAIGEDGPKSVANAISEMKLRLMSAELHLGSLATLGVRINQQDNRCTADPLFCVMEKHEIVVEEGYGHDRIVWVDEEGSEASPTQARRLDALHNNFREIPDKWRRLAVAKQDRFVTACFTEQGCKDFLAAQGHNLRQPFTYVFSLFRNEEMKQLRKLMIGMAKEAQ